MRIMALDIGDRRIGLALSDPGGILASPLTILERTGDEADIARLTALLRKHEVGRVVVGLPRTMEGAIGSQAAKVQDFVGKLKANTDIPVEFRDERLTTVSARRLMQEAGTKKTKKKVRDDAFAAAVILQSYLDEARSD